MAELVDDILTLSKMESAQQPLKLETFNMVDLLYDVSWHLKAKADARGLVFEHRFVSDYLDIEADEKLIERAIANILSNAVRYAKKTVSISCQLLENQMLEIRLSNDGKTISDKDKPHLLNVFIKVREVILVLDLLLLRKSLTAITVRFKWLQMTKKHVLSLDFHCDNIKEILI